MADMKHCQGCDQPQEGVRLYAVRYYDDAHPAETVAYCPDCAMEAKYEIVAKGRDGMLGMATMRDVGAA